MKAALRIAIVATLVGATLVWFREDLALALRLLRGNLTWPLAAGLACCTLLSFANEPLRWRTLLRPRYPDASFATIYHLLTATALLSYTFPARSGLPVRLLMAKRLLNMDYATAGSLLVVDSSLLYTAWALTALLGAMVIIPQRFAHALFAAMAALAIGLGLLFLVLRVDWNRIQRFHRIASFFQRFSEGLKMMTAKAALTNSLLLLVDILFYGARHKLILAGLGVDRPMLAVTLIVAISIFLGFASLMPLGLGGYDLSLVFLLTMIGVPRELALSVPVVNRALMIGAGLILGAVSMNRIPLAAKTPSPTADSANH